MPQIRAVLFDLGGTLFDYAILAQGERESLIELARWAGAQVDPHEIRRTYRAALKRVFYDYLPRSYYLHRELFRDVLSGMAQDLGVQLDAVLLERYWTAQRNRRARDFVLREGVPETLAALRTRGYHLGIVSNADDDQFAHLIELGQLAHYFDSLLSSEQAHSCKPDSAIFNEALRRAGCVPEEALFVGDSLHQDIAGANRVGLRSVLIWSRPDQAPPDREPHPHHVIRHIPELLRLIP